MKNTSVIILVAFVLAAGGYGVYATMNRSAVDTQPAGMEQAEDMMKDDETIMVKTDDVMMQKDEARMPKDAPIGMDSETSMMKQDGKYVTFSPAVLASAATSRRVLFFYANWCPTCNAAEASFTKNLSQIPADVTLIRVNYNDTETDQAEKDLAKKYAVTYQHTFIQIDDQGNEVAKWNGGQIDELVSNVR